MNISTLKTINERCWILTGQRAGSYWECAMIEPTEGKPTEVEFAHDWVIRREEEQGDVLGFIHTHPSGSLDPSKTDVTTMRAWTSCLGRPLLCLITCDDRLEAFLFLDDECDGWRMSAAEFLDENTVVVCDRRLTKMEMETND